jgi:hypothetical protein
MGYGDDSILQLILGGTAVCRCDPGVEFRRLYRFDAEHGFRGPAPKGASDFVELTESLKRCPDTKREFSICLAFEVTVLDREVRYNFASPVASRGKPRLYGEVCF